MASSHDTRVIIYPNYINASRTVAEGRKIPRVKGCEDPTAPEIYDCLKAIGLNPDLENKAYSREALVRGRVRVQVFDNSGRPINPSLPSRRAVMMKVAEIMHQHPHRKLKAKAAETPAAVVGSSSSSAGGGGKKGGKKKR